MIKKRRKLLITVLFSVGILLGLNYLASKFFLVDIVWLLKAKGPECDFVVYGYLNPSGGCPSGYYCDFSHSLIDGPGYCLKK